MMNGLEANIRAADKDPQALNTEYCIEREPG
jgi:hypothetical protein